MAKSNSQRIKERRNKLFGKNPFCPDCKIKMILPEDVGFITLPDGNRKLKIIPKNLCTIEHKYTVNDPRRYLKNHNKEERWSILCVKCNNDRGRKCEFNKKKLIEQNLERLSKNKVGIFKSLIIKIKRLKYLRIKIIYKK